jgi:hypothetical protein
MSMKRVPARTLGGLALNWAVAKCRSESLHSVKDYSTSWMHGGPILDEAGINVIETDHDDYEVEQFAAYDGKARRNQDPENWSNGPFFTFFVDTGIYGETRLTAGLRCYVVSVMGDEVEVPSILLAK